MSLQHPSSSGKEQWVVSREEILKLTALSSCAG
jgi:hypothetical protein